MGLTLAKSENLIKLEFRQITGLTSKQVRPLIKELNSDGVTVTGHGAGTKYGHYK